MDYQQKRMMKSSDEIIVKVGEEEFKTKNVFIGGIKDDGSEDVLACYGGVLDIAEMGLSMMHLLRATIRILISQLGMPIEKSEEFLMMCLGEAMRREEIQEKANNKTAMEQYLRDFILKNQKMH